MGSNFLTYVHCRELTSIYFHYIFNLTTCKRYVLLDMILQIVLFENVGVVTVIMMISISKLLLYTKYLRYLIFLVLIITL